MRIGIGLGASWLMFIPDEMEEILLVVEATRELSQLSRRFAYLSFVNEVLPDLYVLLEPLVCFGEQKETFFFST